MSIKGFGSHSNGKKHPIHNKKGVDEKQFSKKSIDEKIEITRKTGGSYPSRYYEQVKKMENGAKNTLDENAEKKIADRTKELNNSTIQQLMIIDGMNGGKGLDSLSKMIATKLIREKREQTRPISSLQSERYQLVQDSQDVESIREYLGKELAGDYDGYFVNVGDGDYLDVWGFYGGVPYLTTTTHRVN